VAPRLGIDLVEGTVDSTPAVGEVVASLVGREVEAILITGDLTVALAADNVVAEASKGSIPVFSTQPEDASRGVLLAIGADFYQIGRETGDLAARVLGGEDISLMPVQYSLPMQLVINRRVIPKLKSAWVFPTDVLDKAAEVTGSSAKTTPVPIPNK
jgi:putative ABC transport system substrate-binding protein